MQKFDNETVQKIEALAEQAMDEGRPDAERREALRMICKLRGEPHFGIGAIPATQLRSVAAALRSFIDLMPALTVRDATEAISAGFAGRTAPSPHA